METELIALHIFPNPVSKRLFFEIKNLQGEIVQVHVYNAFGQFIHEEQLFLFAGEISFIDVSNFPKGICFLKIILENNQSVQ